MAALDNEVFLSRPFWFFWVGHFDFFSQWKKQPIHMRYHLLLHYGFFFQNLGREAVRTFMHTTLVIWLVLCYFMAVNTYIFTKEWVIFGVGKFLFPIERSSPVWSQSWTGSQKVRSVCSLVQNVYKCTLAYCLSQNV